VRDGIRDAGGIAMEFPLHPIFENCRRPTAALDRNLAYLGLVEILHGYPLDAVVLTTGCDKTTPPGDGRVHRGHPGHRAPGGPMLDGWFEGQLVGSGAAIWASRRRAGGRPPSCRSPPHHGPSAGCNTMGTASDERAGRGAGLSLTGCAAIRRPREARPDGLETGQRIVEMAHEYGRPDPQPRGLLDAIVVNAAIGGSTNAQPRPPWPAMPAAARNGGELDGDERATLLRLCQPAGRWAAFLAGGVPAVVWELQQAGLLRTGRPTVTGHTMAANLDGRETDRETSARSVRRRRRPASSC
jgi:dihydroxy-acid dehydratase